MFKLKASLSSLRSYPVLETGKPMIEEGSVVLYRHDKSIKLSPYRIQTEEADDGDCGSKPVVSEIRPRTVKDAENLVVMLCNAPEEIRLRVMTLMWPPVLISPRTSVMAGADLMSKSCGEDLDSLDLHEVMLRMQSSRLDQLVNFSWLDNEHYESHPLAFSQKRPLPPEYAGPRAETAFNDDEEDEDIGLFLSFRPTHGNAAMVKACCAGCRSIFDCTFSGSEFVLRHQRIAHLIAVWALQEIYSLSHGWTATEHKRQMVMLMNEVVLSEAAEDPITAWEPIFESLNEAPFP